MNLDRETVSKRSVEMRADDARMVKAPAAAAYEQVRKELRAEFGVEQFRAWIEPLTLEAEYEGVLVFCTPSGLARDWLRQNAQHRIEARLSSYLALGGPILICTKAELPAPVRAAQEERAAETARVVAAVTEEAAAEPAAPLATSAGPQTFENFCVGSSNKSAVMVARAIAEGGQTPFSLVLLHGAPGVGKTHLANAIAAESRRRNPARKVGYVMGAIFVEEFQAALHKRKDGAGFKSLVRDNDVLIIDDIQRIAGKKATESEFLDTIALLLAQGKQIVLTADHGAQGLQGFDQRLCDQLKGATECAIGEPDFELRRKILETKAKYYSAMAPNFHVPGPVLDLVASRIHGAGRILDGAVRQLLIETGLQGGEVTSGMAERALHGKFAEPERRPPVDFIIKSCAKYYNLSADEMLARHRVRSIARPRQIAMYLCTKLTTRSLPYIAKRFGGFDHTTVLYARERIGALVQEDGQLAQDIEALTRMIRQTPAQ